MKKLKETLKKLEEGGFMSLSLKERKAVVKEESDLPQGNKERKRKDT